MAEFYVYSDPDTTLHFCLQSAKLAEKHNHTEALINSYGWLAYLYGERGDFDKSQEYNFRSISIAKKSGDNKSIATLYNAIGVNHYVQGNTDSTLFYYEKSLSVRKKTGDRTGLAANYANIGLVQKNLGKIRESLNSLHEALDIYEELDEKREQGIILNNIGGIYKNMGELGTAREYFIRCYNLMKIVGDPNNKATAAINLGRISSQKKDYNKARKYYQEALDGYKTAKNYDGLGSAYNAIGTLEGIEGNRKESMEYFEKALKIAEKNGNKTMQINSLLSLGQHYFDVQKMTLALPMFEKAYELSVKVKYPSELMRSSEKLSEVYTNLGQHSKALELYKVHISMRDSINNTENQKSIAKQQAKYEYDKQKTIDDAQHDKEIAIEKESEAKQRILTYSVSFGLGLVIIFLLVVFNRLKITRKQKRIIESQKQEVENQKSVVEYAHADLEKKNKEITDSIRYAKRIQHAILPPTKVVKEYLQESFVYYKPKDIVAGDFYWMEQRDGRVIFAAADCTGHGVPGAMVSVVCNNGLNRSVREYGLTDPGEILDKTREIIVQEFEKSEDDVKDGMDIALCVIDGDKLHYAGANNPLWLIREGELIETKANKQPIGRFDNQTPYTTHTVQLQKGDCIYVFSDGYSDQFGGEKGKKLKTVNFKKLLLSIQHETMQQQKDSIDKAFNEWKGNLEQLDDVCVIGVRV